MRQSFRSAWLAFALAGCAAKSPPVEPSPPPAMLDQVQAQACAACRMTLQVCMRTAQAGAENLSGSSCMDQFMTCLETQHVDRIRCSSF